MIEETGLIFNYFLEAYKQKEVVRELKKGQTKEVQGVIKDIIDAIRKLEYLVRFKYTKKSATYQFVFPKGMSEYCSLNKSNIETLLSRISLFLKREADEIDPGISNRIIELYKEYKEKREIQLEKKDTFELNTQSKKELRYELVVCMQVNILNLAAIYPGLPDKAAIFFDEKLLKLKHIKRTEFYKKHFKAKLLG